MRQRHEGCDESTGGCGVQSWGPGHRLGGEGGGKRKLPVRGDS